MATTDLCTAPQPAVTSKWIPTAFILMVGAIVLYYEELETSVMPTRSVIWGSLALTVYLLALLCLLGHGEGPIRALVRWKFGAWILLWYALTFGLASIIWSKPQPSPVNEITVISVLRALQLVAFGMTFWVTGYFVGRSQLPRHIGRRALHVLTNRRSNAIRSPFTPYVIYIVGTLARLAVFATTGRFGYVGNPASAVSSATAYQQLLTELTFFCPFGVCVAALQVYRGKVQWSRVTLATLFVVEITFGATLGGKESFVYAVLAVAIPMSAARRRLPKGVVLASIVAFLLVIIPFNQAYRSAVRGGPGLLSTSQAIDATPGILRQAVIDQNFLSLLGNSANYLLERVQEIEGPAIIIQRTPGQIPFVNAVGLIEAPLVDSIPRAVWPGKPILDPGYNFSQQYYEIPSNIYTSSAISPIGDLYMHGGWIPVLIGMFLFGYGVRVLDDILDIRANSHAIFLILLLFPNLVKGESDWSTFAAGLPSEALVWLLGIVIIFKPLTVRSSVNTDAAFLGRRRGHRRALPSERQGDSRTQPADHNGLPGYWHESGQGQQLTGSALGVADLTFIIGAGSAEL